MIPCYLVKMEELVKKAKVQNSVANVHLALRVIVVKWMSLSVLLCPVKMEVLARMDLVLPTTALALKAGEE